VKDVVTVEQYFKVYFCFVIYLLKKWPKVAQLVRSIETPHRPHCPHRPQLPIYRFCQ